jgi:hypothetical protein
VSKILVECILGRFSLFGFPPDIGHAILTGKKFLEGGFGSLGLRMKTNEKPRERATYVCPTKTANASCIITMSTANMLALL